MKKCLLIILTASIAMTNGCSGKRDKAKNVSCVPSNPSSEDESSTLSKALQVVRGELAPETVLVDIDGAKLTAGEAKMLIEFRIASIIEQIPPERVNSVKAGMLKNEIEQFIHKNLLLQEADKQKIEATKEDQDLALQKIAAQLPPNMTLEQAMDSSPWGRENLIKEMVTSIKISKLLKPFQENPITVTDQELDEFYRINREKLDKPEKIRARHILIKTDMNDSPEIKAEKRKRIEEIRQKIVDGADFAEMAKEFSECASGKMGGDWGEFTRNSPLPLFKDAAFAQELNKLGPVVETEAGYHIIEVTGHRDATTMPREKLIGIVRNTKRQEIIRKYADDLRQNANISYPVIAF